MGRPLGMPVAALAVALLCAACSGGRTATSTGSGGHGQAAASAAPAASGGAAATASGVSTGSGAGTAARGGPGAATPGSGGPSAAVHGAAALPAAAAGTYPVNGSSSSSSTGQPTPAQTAGTGTLTVSAPQTTSAGTEQDQTYHFGNDSLVTHDVYAAGGEVLITRSGSSSFNPPLPIVPAGLHDGMSWGPMSFTSGGASGTFSGSAGQTTQATVGGVVVTVVPITLHLQITGTYQGAQYTATAVQTLNWAPSLHLAVHLHMTTDARYAAAATYHSDIDVSLLSTRPQ